MIAPASPVMPMGHPRPRVPQKLPYREQASVNALRCTLFKSLRKDTGRRRDRYEPRSPHIELRLVNNHPLGGSPHLVPRPGPSALHQHRHLHASVHEQKVCVRAFFFVFHRDHRVNPLRFINPVRAIL